MKSGGEHEAQRSDSEEFNEEDIFSELYVPTNFVASLAAINTFPVVDAPDSLDLSSDDNSARSSYSEDPHPAVSGDFIGCPPSTPAPSPDFFNFAIGTQIFVTNGVVNYIIDTSSILSKIIATIVGHGWIITHPVPDEYSELTEIIGAMQLEEKLGITCERLVFEEDEPSYHKVTKHFDDKDDGGGSHFGSSADLPAFSVNLIASSDSKEKASSATSIGGTTASLALNSLIVISAMMAMSSLTGSGYFDSNSIVDSFKHNLLEGIDYYMIS